MFAGHDELVNNHMWPKHGLLLHNARISAGLSQREAARRAEISEGRWRQVVTGVQKVGGGMTAPVNSKPSTLAAMARAVGLSPDEVLRAAGHDPETVGGSSQDDDHGGYVAAPGAEVEQGVSNAEVLRAIQQMRADHEMLLAGQRSLSERLEQLEQRDS